MSNKVIVVSANRELLVEKAVQRMLYHQPNDISIKKDIHDAMRKVLIAVLDEPLPLTKEGERPEIIMQELADTATLIASLEERRKSLLAAYELDKTKQIGQLQHQVAAAGALTHQTVTPVDGEAAP